MFSQLSGDLPQGVDAICELSVPISYFPKVLLGWDKNANEDSVLIAKNS